MKYVIYVLSIIITHIFIPFNAFSEEISSEDYLIPKYSMLLTPDLSVNPGNGLVISYLMRDKHTRFSTGIYTSKIRIPDNETKPLPVGLGVTGTISDFDVDLNFELGDIMYQSERKGTRFDILLQGEYIFKEIEWNIKSGATFKKRSHLMLSTGIGVKINISTLKTVYKIYLNDELFDQIENPLSGSKSSGIKFFSLAGIEYKYSVFVSNFQASVILPDIKKSFFLLSFGIAI